MKRYSLLILSILAIALYSCEETGPIIILEAPIEPLTDTTFISDTPITPSLRNVLIEEFSGVRCTGCPAGNAKVHELIAQYSDRIVPITAHIPSDPQTIPYSGSPDLRTQEAEKYTPLTGVIGVKPSSLISREVINGSMQVASVNSWEGYMQPILAEEANVNLSLEIVSNNVTERTFRYKITLSYPNAIAAQGLGIALTESEIIAEQLDGTDHIDDYEHEFVLRKFITPIIGEQLPVVEASNTVIIKEYEIDLDHEEYNPDANWEISNMELVVFIVDNDGTIETASSTNIVE